MLERRRHVRARNFAAGTVAYRVAAFGSAAQGRRATVDCVVRDASEGGALLLLDEPRRAPVEMELATRDGVRPARVVWRGETGVGVAFLAASAFSPAAVPVGAPAPAAPAAVVVDLDAVRRCRVAGSDESRLAERIARFVRPSRRPDPA